MDYRARGVYIRTQALWLVCGGGWLVRRPPPVQGTHGTKRCAWGGSRRPGTRPPAPATTNTSAKWAKNRVLRWLPRASCASRDIWVKISWWWVCGVTGGPPCARGAAGCPGTRSGGAAITPKLPKTAYFRLHFTISVTDVGYKILCGAFVHHLGTLP